MTKPVYKIELVYNCGFRWNHRDNWHVKGYLWDSRGILYAEEQILDFFNKVDNEQIFYDKLKEANGLFSVVRAHNDGVWLAVDRLRSFPLFFRNIGGDYTISDSVDVFRNKKLNLNRMDEFLACAYVTGNETLFSGIFQVQPGEMAAIGQSCNTRFYFNYLTPRIHPLPVPEIEESAITALEAVFERLIVSLNGRTAVVPLSGGYDSRLIAAMLKKFNYKNVVCFTFGRRDNNAEWPVSQMVSEKLGFPWYFIETTHELIREYMVYDSFMEYYRFSANGTSMFYMQEYFAAKILREKGIVPDDAIFIPGHTGDFLAGSQLTKLNIREHISIKKITGRILNFRYNLNPIPMESRRRYKRQVHSQIREILQQNPEASTYSIFENWDQKERLSKLIGNSANVYNYFGYEHRLPFYDLEMLTFFRDLPYRFKRNKQLYSRVLREKYFMPLGIDFLSAGLQPVSARVQWQWLKEIFKPYLPERLKILFYQGSDPYFYGPITDVMILDMKKRGLSLNTAVRHRNGVIVQWYLKQLMIEEPCA